MQPPSTRHQRRFDGHAAAAFLPLVALFPAWLLTVAGIWWVVAQVWWTPFPLFALAVLLVGATLFLRPVQRIILTRLLGARTPTRDENDALQRAWRVVAQANHIPPGRFVLAVVDSDDLNAFASGGHLVVVSSWAVANLDHEKLCGVLAHELSHHLGMHTVALTIGQWLALPVVLFAQVGFVLQNVADAAAGSFGRRSQWGDAVGRTIAGLLTIVSWLFLAVINMSQLIGNAVGKGAEFRADESVVEMGFGRELRDALRLVIARGLGERHDNWRDRLLTAHPPARTRVVRIDAQLRNAAKRHT